ncbi:MAG: hypothetical protein ACLFVU_03205 [Phycisphaerae bacterium]
MAMTRMMVVGPATYFYAAVEQGQKDVAQLLFDLRYAGGANAPANHRAQAIPGRRSA